MTARTNKMSAGNSRAACMREYRKWKRLEEDNCNNVPKITKLNLERQRDYRKYIYNAELVDFMKDTFEIYVLSDLSQGATRPNSCVDMVFGRNVDNLSCMHYVSYFSYRRPILSRTNRQALPLTDVTAN
jgi:hypothetical protein